MITISDSRTAQTDSSGDAIAQALKEAGHTIVAARSSATIPGRSGTGQSAAADVQVIITTGGTGITSRDSTYEAIVSLLDKRLDGFGELFRMLSYEQVDRRRC